jgi:hypothetical protein
MHLAEIARSYAREHARAEVGDLVQDLYNDRTIIRVEKIVCHKPVNDGFPQAKYVGQVHKVDGTPTMKKQEDCTWNDRCRFYVPKAARAKGITKTTIGDARAEVEL